VLRGVGETENLYHAVSVVDHGSGRADGAAEPPNSIQCDGASNPRAKGSGDKGGEVDSRSSVRPNSDGSTPERQGGEQALLGIPPVLVPGSGAGYDPRPRILSLAAFTADRPVK